MKYVVYQHVFFDLLIPVTMTIALLGISQVLALSKLGQLGSQLSNVAVPVVYLHVPINSVLLVEYHLHYGVAAAVLIGFMAPVILSKLVFDRFSLTRLLFYGQAQRKPSSPAQVSA
jgi:hypothetical protein